jgi:YVTN family beta-propeller protein
VDAGGVPDAAEAMDSGFAATSTSIWLAQTAARIGHLAFDPSGEHLFASNMTLDQIDDYSVSERRFLEPIALAVGAQPMGFDLTPDGSRIYTANQGAGTVSVIDLAQHAVVATLTPPQVIPALMVTPYEIAIGDAGRALLTMTLDGTGDTPLFALDLSSGVFTRRNEIGDPTERTNLLASQDRRRIGISFGGISSGDVSIYLADTDTFIHPIQLNDYVYEIAVDRVGSRYIVSGKYVLDGSLNRLGSIANSTVGVGLAVDQPCVFSSTSSVAYRVGPAGLETLDLVALRKGAVRPMPDTIFGPDGTLVGGPIAVSPDSTLVAIRTARGISFMRLP